MSDHQTPTVLTDAQLLVWAVILEHRQQSQKRGINILLLPLPPCPTCDEAVHDVHASYDYEQPLGHGRYRYVAAPCGHNHTASDDSMERAYEHGRQMLDGIEIENRLGRGPHTDDIIKEAEARVGKPDEPHQQDAPSPTAKRFGRTLTERVIAAPAAARRRHALAFNAVGPVLAKHDRHLPFTVRQEIAEAVLAAIDNDAEATA